MGLRTRGDSVKRMSTQVSEDLGSLESRLHSLVSFQLFPIEIFKWEALSPSKLHALSGPLLQGAQLPSLTSCDLSLTG